MKFNLGRIALSGAILSTGIVGLYHLANRICICSLYINLVPKFITLILIATLFM